MLHCVRLDSTASPATPRPPIPSYYSPPLPFPHALSLASSARYEMHEAMHWLATNPRDIGPGDWDVDASKYAWTCQAYHVHMVGLEEDRDTLMEAYRSEFAGLDSLAACGAFQARWGAKFLNG